MHAKLNPNLLNTEQGQLADDILRRCVHCGFCLATCPTYQLLGDELDSPRGRIYLMKEYLSGEADNPTLLIKHLDRCLTCQSCETTCPSGVRYTELLSITRDLVEEKRQPMMRVYRYAVRFVLTTPWLINTVVFLLPFVKHKGRHNKAKNIKKVNKGRVLLLSGCLQDTLAKSINDSAEAVLNRLGFDVIKSKQSQCCGALDKHLSFDKAANQQIQANIDDWSALLPSLTAIISTSSACALMIKNYANEMAATVNSEKAQLISDKSMDMSQFLATQDLSLFACKNRTKISLHTPCTLTHGLKLDGVVKDILSRLGYQLTPTNNSHLCCGAAGTYSIFNKKIAKQLRENKIKDLNTMDSEMLVTANIGCLLHLAKESDKPVRHWLELLVS